MQQKVDQRRGATVGRFLRHLLPPPLPALRDLPGAIAKAILFGSAVGPILSILFGVFPNASWEHVFHHPAAWLAESAAAGALFAFCFYVACAVPVGYARRAVRNLPRMYAILMPAITGLAGGSLAYWVALRTIQLFSEDRTVNLPRAIVIAGAIAMLLALVRGVRDRLQAEKKLADARARFKVLQAQINPHFFFNTLNTISALIPLDPDTAQRTVGLLAEMSRYAFSSVQTEVVPLTRELDFARAYLEIEKARFRSRLHFQLPCASEAQEIMVPALALQPIIENAVRYGVGPHIEGGSVDVRVHRRHARFSLTVENRTDGSSEISESAFFRPDHALSNIRERLRLAYNGRAFIRITEPHPHTVAVTIEAPIRP